MLWDEFLTHRLGLIPIACDLRKLDAMKLKDECACDEEENCRKCKVVFTLKAKHSETTTWLKRDITTRDLTPHPDYLATGIEPVHFTNKKEAQESNDTGIRICTIGPGQRLELRCTARKNIGKVHAKWQPVSTAVFQQEPDINLNQSRISEMTRKEKKSFVECCPTKVFEYSEISNKVRVKDNLACVMCNECLKFSDALKNDRAEEDVLTLGIVPQKFIFTVESTGALPPEDIVVCAIRILEQKLMEISNGVEAIEQELETGGASTKMSM